MTAKRGQISVVLADDHAVVRSALKMLLENEDGIEVVAEAENAASAIRYVGGHRPSVLILDINMPGGSGLAAIPEIRSSSPETSIVMLTMQEETASAREALQAGVLGYILKEAASEESRPYASPPRARPTSSPSSARGSRPSPRWPPQTTSATASSRC